MFQYLPALEAAGLSTRVIVATPDSVLAASRNAGAASRIRYYLSALVRTWTSGIRLLWGLLGARSAVVQKVLLPAPLAWALRLFRGRVVYDFDDAIFTTEDPHAGWLARARARRHGRGLPRMLRAASCAVVENAYTGAYAARFCPRVVTITGPIDTERYRPADLTERAEVVLGWIGSPSTRSYLEPLRKPLVELSRRYTSLQVLLIGVSGFEESGVHIRCEPWALDTEVSLLQACDIGLMPLPDDPWTRGKGGYKILQYASVGLPVAASPVGVNSVLVEDGVTGFLADSSAEWVSVLSRLIDDAALRRKMGRAGREKMEAHYSLHVGAHRFLDLLRSTMRNE